MRPELFHIPFVNRPIPSFGVMLAIALLATIFLSRWLARRSGVRPELMENAALLALLSGILGARLMHVLENIETYTDSSRSLVSNLWAAVNVSSGGLTYYGGVLLATPVLIAYAVHQKIPVRHGMDIIAPCLMLGLGIGRIGCFLNGCCVGGACSLPWAVSFPFGSYAYVSQWIDGQVAPPPELLTDISESRPNLLPANAIAKDPRLSALAATQRSLPLHPAQLYSTVTAFLLCGLLVTYFSLPHIAGHVFMLMLILEGSSRFILELLRDEPAVTTWFGQGWSISMVVGLLLVIAGAIGWWAFARWPVLPPWAGRIATAAVSAKASAP